MHIIGICKNNMDGMYYMLNICTECVVPICDAIWTNKAYGNYA